MSNLLANMEKEFVMRRIGCNDQELVDSIYFLAKLLVDWKSSNDLCYAGFPAKPINFSKTHIAEYLSDVRSSNQTGELEVFSLSDAPNNPRVLLLLSEVYIHGNLAQDIYFPICELDNNDSLLDPDSFCRLALQGCSKFQADFGWVRDYELSLLFGRSNRQYNFGISRTPREEQQYILKPTLPSGMLEDPLPELLCIDEFNDLEIPNGIWWINYWNSSVSERIGKAKIYNAPWAKIFEQDDGAMLLMATEEITDIRNSEHMARLRQIADIIDLRHIQESYLS
ncbi:MAG: hypothetical protein AAF215_24635 [Cyanobacteria bacterium P01_A01_bin.123]